jgi:hypothetical protein
MKILIQIIDDLFKGRLLIKTLIHFRNLLGLLQCQVEKAAELVTTIENLSFVTDVS